MGQLYSLFENAWYNEIGDFMRILQFILSMILLYVFLLVAWPLFLILFVVLAVYWIWAVWKIRKATNQAFDDFKQQESIQRPIESGEVIDAEYTEREE
jgi:membrane protein implicated in regulation of membrane protease activity